VEAYYFDSRLGLPSVVRGRLLVLCFPFLALALVRDLVWHQVLVVLAVELGWCPYSALLATLEFHSFFENDVMVSSVDVDAYSRLHSDP
jgi:hypothetical protein